MTTRLYDSAYLQCVHSLLTQTKLRSYELLGPLQDRFIVDIGCGTGDDAIALSQRGGKVVGIDREIDFITAARNQISSNDRVEFFVSDCCSTTLPSHSADIVRYDRVFQHLEHPVSALEESMRILKNDGQIQIIDVDYRGMTMFLPDIALERKVIDHVCEKRIPHADNVRAIPHLLNQLGFTHAKVEVCPCLIPDYQTAKFLIRFDLIIAQLLEAASITDVQHTAWQKFETKPEDPFNFALNHLIITARKS
jgi:ubiquinone/menaquinone biosynthesis C-methylase UbiE